MNPKIGTSVRAVNSTGMYYKSYIVYIQLTIILTRKKGCT